MEKMVLPAMVVLNAEEDTRIPLTLFKPFRVGRHRGVMSRELRAAETILLTDRIFSGYKTNLCANYS